MPLPIKNRMEWGPGTDLERLGLTAVTHKAGLIEAENGETEIRFKTETDVKVIIPRHDCY